MAIVTLVDMDNPATGLYVPFRGIDRRRGACGTLNVHKDLTGDASGGTLTISYRAQRLMFGFHPLIVPRHISTKDNQASGTPVRVQFNATGNERLFSPLDIVDRKKETVASVNVNTFSFDDFMVLIESQDEAPTIVMDYIWGTNTDTKVYHSKAFFILYDLEAIGRGAGYIPDGVFLNS